MSTAIGISGKLPVPRGTGRGERRSSESEASAAHHANGSPAADAGRPAGRVFAVAPEELEHLQRGIQALGRRARRIGVEPVRLIDTGERDASGNALVLLSGRAPVLAGWTLAAIVDHRDGHTKMRPVGEQGDRLAAGAFAAASCEHCGLRRRRTRTYVVVHADSGEVHQVGSGCLQDFLGGPDPARACRRAELLAAARAELDRAGTLTIGPDGASTSVEEFAAHAAHVVRIHGFTSRERARRTSRPATADLALQSVGDTPGAPDSADRALADGALGWARELLAARRDLSPFERNAVAAVNSGSIQTRRDRGLVCALIAVYRQRRARSRHLAHLGARIEVTVLVERVLTQRSERHGTVRRCELIDADANRLVWWQTAGAPLHHGEVVTLTGRVQHHTRFGASAVTVLSHCRRP
jgi:hypothetical protein